jgi:prepilin-type processing-associated H-X9-DG protein
MIKTAIKRHNETFFTVVFADGNVQAIPASVIEPSVVAYMQATFENYKPYGWQMPDKPIKVKITNAKVSEHILNNTALGQALTASREAFREQTFVSGDFTEIYVANISPEFQQIFDQFPDVVIINRPF